MMRVLQNRFVAVVIVLAVIVLSTVVGSGVSLYNERDQVRAVYLYGDDGSGKGLAGYIRDMIDQSRNMVTLAANYADDVADLSGEVSRCVDELEQSAEASGAQRKAIDALYAATTALDNNLFRQQLSELEKTMLDKLTANIDSSYHIIGRERETYNRAVDEYNRKLEAFPANILGGFAGVRPLEQFV